MRRRRPLLGQRNASEAGQRGALEETKSSVDEGFVFRIVSRMV